MQENQELADLYRNCSLCPRSCGVDRSSGKTGPCGQPDYVRIAWMGLHRGEEPPVTGTRGSGTIFFCGCPLHCAFCQNHQISAGCFSQGVAVGVEEFASLMLDMQELGAANLNMVTGTHFIPSIVMALDIAKENGLHIPVVWNSSGYETVESLELIDPYVDLYLMDVKTLDSTVAQKFCGTAGYVDAIVPVADWLLRHRRTKVRSDGRLTGLLIRHLLFPGALDATKDFLAWFARHAKHRAWLSLMVQFVPPAGNESFSPINATDYRQLLGMLEELDIENGFVQELGDNIPWIPDFTRENPFPETFADPLPSFIAKRDHQ